MFGVRITASALGLATLLAGLASGCLDPNSPLYSLSVLPFLPAAGLEQARAARKPCGGQACDPERWLIVMLHRVGISIAAPKFGFCAIRPQSVASPRLVESGPVIVDGDARRSDGRLALALSDGRLVLLRLGQQRFEQQRRLAARAVRWSNDGTRLAAVVEVLDGAHDPGLALVLLDAELNELDELALPLETPGVSSRAGWAYTVSWSAGDERLAVCGPRQKTPQCVVVTFQDRQAQAFAWRKAFFVGKSAESVSPVT